MPEPLPPERSSERRYRIVARIGQGACGKVYRAIFTYGPVEKEVALKVIHPTADQRQELLHRLMDEARYLGMLNHEAIVKVDSIVKLRGSWAVVMEYADGVDLKQVLAQARLPVRVALEISTELAGALDYAWRRKDPSGRPICLVHRDVKPSNVQITSGGKVKLLDFGIARGETSRAAETHSIQPLTPGYASPERIRQWVDPQAPRLSLQDGPAGDVFSLGMVLAEMLLGEHPGQAVLGDQSYTTWLGRILRGIEALDGCPAELPALVAAMLSMRAERRPSAAEVEARCQEMLDGLKGERLRSWLPRVLPAAFESSPSTSSDPWVGEVLSETDAVETPSATPDPPGEGTLNPAPRRPVAALAGALLVVGLGVGAALALGHVGHVTPTPAPLSSEAPVAPTTAAPAASPVAAPSEQAAPAASSTAPQVGAGTDPTTQRVAVEPTPGSTPAQKKASVAQSMQSSPPSAAVAPTSAPAPDAQAAPPSPPLYRVSFSGAEAVTLVQGTQRWELPTQVPAGSYEMRARFQGRDGEQSLPEVEVVGTSLLRCSAAAASCKIVR